MTPVRTDGTDAVRETDVVVLGAGAAGLCAAGGLAGRRVDLLSKGPLALTGNSPWAQGGVAAAVGEADTPELHARDTLAVGGAMGDPRAVARLTADAPARLADLIALGARFDRDLAGQLDLAREAAHSRSRVLHARDATGAEIVRALRAALADTSGLVVFENAFALELVVDGGRVAGVLARHADGAVVLHRARAVVLATGGIGHIFARTTNPREATGDGLALAWRAGARLADLEFVQFHPTALDTGDDPMPLLTEALRGAGARLVDEEGRPLLEGGDLQPRDVVARALWAALAAGRRPALDAREAVGDSFPSRFPTVFEACRVRGLDPRAEAIPVAPAAHYHMGGVVTDLEGRTSLPGLWAAGEVACTGVHGANRLASNSLLEALVFGAGVARSVDDALVHLPRSTAKIAPPPAVSPAAPSDEETASVIATVRRIAWEDVGLVRHADGLHRALRGLEALAGEARDHDVPGGSTLDPQALHEARNMIDVARLVARCALSRPESRGAHFRSDHPETDPSWQRRQVVERRGETARIGLAPVSASPPRREVPA